MISGGGSMSGASVSMSNRSRGTALNVFSCLVLVDFRS